MTCNKEYLLKSFFNIQEKFNIPIHTWRWLEVKFPPEDKEDRPKKIILFHWLACVAGIIREGEGERGRQEKIRGLGRWEREGLPQEPHSLHFCVRRQTQISDWLIFNSKSLENWSNVIPLTACPVWYKNKIVDLSNDFQAATSPFDQNHHLYLGFCFFLNVFHITKTCQNVVSFLFW